jgi:hypothetical protein
MRLDWVVGNGSYVTSVAAWVRDASAAGVASLYDSSAVWRAMPGLRNDDVVGVFHAWSTDRGAASECWRDFVGGTGNDRESLVTSVGSPRKMGLANS